ncbi:hypothetical protein GX408_10350 [bacterium]|nr:hypothetical protein [bacterium]
MRKPNFFKPIFSGAILSMALGLGLSTMVSAQGPNVNPLFTEKKVRNYLPHMTHGLWMELFQQ